MPEQVKESTFQTPEFKSIIDIRLVIDSFINSIPFLRGGREVSLTHTSLQRSFMWLGEALKSTGSQSPYVNSENPASKEIEPQAEKTKDSLIKRWEVIEDTHTARVKDFRFCLSECISGFEKWQMNSESAGTKYDKCLEQSWIALKEAKLWLGWELARIRDFLAQEAAGFPTSPGRKLPL